MDHTTQSINNRSRYESAYQDTMFFINAIAKDYDFYDDLFESIKEGSTEISIKKRELKKSIDATWVSAIEESLPSLDLCLRKPGKRIEEIEQVLPIELSRNITSRSLQHLCQHTNLISKVEGDVITPSKILNVYRDESLDTYENKFLNTLVLRLYMFIDRRYTQITESGFSTTSSRMEFSSTFKNGSTTGKFHFGIEMEENNEQNSTTDIGSLMRRIERLKSISNQYLNSDFCQQMGKSYVRPPIMRTNAITKNKDLRQCLLLWQFIESYENIGCEIAIQETAEAPNAEYIHELYSMLALQYVVFRYNVSEHFDDDRTLARSSTDKPLLPKFITEFDDYTEKEFNVYDTVYRKVVPMSQTNNRSRLTDDEKSIREAIDFAFDLDEELLRIQMEKEKERKRIAAEKRREKMKKMAEKQRRQKKLAKQRAASLSSKRSGRKVPSTSRSRRNQVFSGASAEAAAVQPNSPKQ